MSERLGTPALTGAAVFAHGSAVPLPEGDAMSRARPAGPGGPPGRCSLGFRAMGARTRLSVFFSSFFIDITEPIQEIPPALECLM